MKYKIGERYEGSNNHWFTITGYTDNLRYREIIFDSGYKTIVSTSNIPRKNIKDWMSPSVCGVGIVGSPKMRFHPLYTKWRNMISRCYDQNNIFYSLYGGRGIIVSDELLNLCNFIEIVKQLDNYEKLLRDPHMWQIDKDLKSGERKIYSKDTISILSAKENQWLATLENHKSIYQFDLNGQLVYKYDNLLDVHKETNFNMSNICHCITGKYKHAYNFIWLDEDGINEISKRVIFANTPKRTNNKTVLQFDINNNFLREYQSVKHACEKSCYKPSNISACCRGEHKTAYGYVWKYKGENGMYSFDAKKVKDDCIQFIKNFFEENGKDCNAVVGISGGKDSSIVAALCVEALGKDRVIGVLMPNGEQSDISYSYFLCGNLGIKFVTVPIEDAVNGVLNAMKENVDISDQTTINLPARIRMSTLYAVSQSMNGRVANTCNLSEDWVGYSTRYGDAAGDFSPLSNLTVTEIKQIGKVLGLPDELIDKVPTDGLCGKTDEDNLGFTYDVLDKYIRTGEIEDKEVKNRIDMMHKKNLFKLQLMPSFQP